MALTGPTPTPPHQKKPVKVVLWTAVWLSCAIIGAVVMSTFDDPKGTPLFDQTVLVQSISAAAIFAAALGPSFIANRRDTQTIKHEVKNDHKVNLRLEQDGRYHSQQSQGITIIGQNEKILNALAEQNRELKSLHKKIDVKTDKLREEFQEVQHENVARFVRIEGEVTHLSKGLLSWLRGDPMPLTAKDEDDDRI